MGAEDSGQQYKGRLELTWTNKGDRLVGRDDGSYEWVPSSDYRVAEVRLLHDAGSVGENPDANLLVRGDALHALTSLGELAQYEGRCLGKVKLAYLDPPFNTQQAFAQYDDALEHSVWLTMMRDRLLQVKRLLTPDGSVWVHCDDSEQAYLKAVMDELFGRESFIACIIWQKTTSARNDATRFSIDQDYILVYANADFRPNGVPRSEASEKAYKNPDEDPRGSWREGDYKAGTGYSYPIKHPKTGADVLPPEGQFWRYPPDAHEQHLRDNLLWWGKTQNYSMPKMKRFRSAVGDLVVPQTLWLADEVDTTRRAKTEIKELFPGQTPFATPKPERLLARIIEVGSNPGDVVLDCFLGSGTTAAVAHKLDRRWIGIEWSKETVAQVVIPRLEKVVKGEDQGGISEAVGWKGGGGFSVLDVGASMFDSDEGEVVISEWATNGRLSEATAAQLHFTAEDDPPFCGRKGKHRLAVIDGLVSSTVVELLVARLDGSEELTLCGTSVDPDAASRLKELRPGSRIKKIPASLLADYQQSALWKPVRRQKSRISNADEGRDRQKVESSA